MGLVFAWMSGVFPAVILSISWHDIEVLACVYFCNWLLQMRTWLHENVCMCLHVSCMAEIWNLKSKIWNLKLWLRKSWWNTHEQGRMICICIACWLKVDEFLMDIHMKPKEIGMDVLWCYGLGVSSIVMLKKKKKKLVYVVILRPNSPPRKGRGKL